MNPLIDARCYASALRTCDHAVCPIGGLTGSWCLFGEDGGYIRTKRMCTYLESQDCPVCNGLGELEEVTEYLRSINNLGDDDNEPGQVDLETMLEQELLDEYNEGRGP